jgi:hypothetical protein
MGMRLEMLAAVGIGMNVAVCMLCGDQWGSAEGMFFMHKGAVHRCCVVLLDVGV